MARRKTGDHWQKRAWEIYQNAKEPKPGSKRIADQLARDFESDDTGPPGERVVRGYLHEFRLLPDAVKHEYEYFTWPHAMETGLLPWEASRDVLDLLGYLRVSMGLPDAEVPVPVARWYWRACQVMPGAPIPNKLTVAGQLAAWDRYGKQPAADVVGVTDNVAALQGYLAAAPWRSPDAQAAYDGAVKAGALEKFASSIEGDRRAAELIMGFTTPGLHAALEETFNRWQKEDAGND